MHRKRILVIAIVGAAAFLTITGGALAYFLVGSNAPTAAVHTAAVVDLVVTPDPVFHVFEWYPGMTATQQVTIANPPRNPDSGRPNPPLRVRLTGGVGWDPNGLANALRLDIPAFGYSGSLADFVANGTPWSAGALAAGTSTTFDVTLTFVDSGTVQNSLADTYIDFNFAAQGRTP